MKASNKDKGMMKEIDVELRKALSEISVVGKRTTKAVLNKIRIATLKAFANALKNEDGKE